MLHKKLTVVKMLSRLIGRAALPNCNNYYKSCRKSVLDCHKTTNRTFFIELRHRYSLKLKIVTNLTK